MFAACTWQDCQCCQLKTVYSLGERAVHSDERTFDAIIRATAAAIPDAADGLCITAAAVYARSTAASYADATADELCV